MYSGCYTQPAVGLKAKASAQRYGTINATSVFFTY